MPISNVSLSSASKNGLQALQQTNNALNSALSTLATGKKIKSFADNAQAFAASQAFLNQANDLSNVKDNVSTALQTVNVANIAIDSVSKLVDQAKGLATAALQTQDPTQRAAFAQQFDDLRGQIDDIVKDASLNGRNLVDGTSGNVTVNFNADNTSSLTLNNSDLTSSGLGIAASTGAFANNSDINSALSNLTTASTTLRTTSASLGSNASVISTRQDFTSSLINNLQASSDNLTQADPNEAAANLLALQAQSAFATTSLSISSKAQQAILKLF